MVDTIAGDYRVVVTCDQSTVRGKAGYEAAANALSALFDACAIGGSARERAADEACRYFVLHFVELAPAGPQS